MAEQTCSYCREHETVRCGATGVVDYGFRGWRCPAHAQLAPGYRLVRESDLREIAGEGVLVGWYRFKDHPETSMICPPDVVDEIIARLSRGQEDS